MNQLTKGFILRKQPYRETSFLIEVFTLESGIVSLVFRGAKNLKNPARSQIVSPFNLIQVSFDHKKKSLTFLKNYEIIKPYDLSEVWLYCGFYLNEILLKLLGNFDVNLEMFHLYHHTIRLLSAKPNPSKTSTLMRYFEIRLIQQIGFGVDFIYDSKREKIDKNEYYLFHIDFGFIKQSYPSHPAQISGQSLIVLNELIKQDIRSLDETMLKNHQKEVLSLMRKIINYALNGKVVQSRQMMIDYLNL